MIKRMAKTKAAKQMLEMLSKEKFELAEHDNFDEILSEWAENFGILQRNMVKKGKNSKNEPLLKPGLHERDGKSSFEMIKVNYPNMIKLASAKGKDVGANSHCTFFEFEIVVDIRVCFENLDRFYSTKIVKKGTFREKKQAEKAAYTKIVTAFAKKLKTLEHDHGPINFDGIANWD